MNLNLLMNQGIRTILKTAGHFYIKDRQGRAFLSHMAPRIQKSIECRNQYEQDGIHIPTFLIASITSKCNLHCSGCYSRANGACNDRLSRTDLSTEEWLNIFDQASDLGIPFVLLAGGEPFMRPDLIAGAARNKDVIFPVFTNGTMIDNDCLTLLEENRNVIPVFSIEGNDEQTDMRRGDGVSMTVHTAMNALREKGVLFGASITVTRENMHIVTTPSFMADLRNKGCGLVFFVEYVPAAEGTEYLALTTEDLEVLAAAVSVLKKKTRDMIILSFPGDEAAMGGCLASGRGFFHVNAAGGADPCPFSPYAKYNLRTSSILDVLKSDYFAKLREIAESAGEHVGGCTLFDQKDRVSAVHSGCPADGGAEIAV